MAEVGDEAVAKAEKTAAALLARSARRRTARCICDSLRNRFRTSVIRSRQTVGTDTFHMLSPLPMFDCFPYNIWDSINSLNEIIFKRVFFRRSFICWECNVT